MDETSDASGDRPLASLAFLGPALGVHEGWVTTQGEMLAGLFAASGERVLVSSAWINPVALAAEHARDLLRWRQQADVAIVSVFSGRAFALADESLTLADAVGMGTVAWLHGGNLPSFAEAHPRWVRRVLRRADVVVAPSRYLARWAATVVDGVEVIPNVLALEDYRYVVRSPIRPRLLWMRTFQELYDPVTALEVLAILRSTGVDAVLTMAGQDKGLLGATRARARDLGVEPWVTFAGFVSGSAKTALLDDHDVFLNTNLVDNAPVTVLEAAASGLVVLSSDVGGIPDLLEDGVSARLVPPSQPIAMADALRDLLGDPAAAGELAVAGRFVAEHSGWPSVRDRWTRLLARMVTPGRRPGSGSPPP